MNRAHKFFLTGTHFCLYPVILRTLWCTLTSCWSIFSSVPSHSTKDNDIAKRTNRTKKMDVEAMIKSEIFFLDVVEKYQPNKTLCMFFLSWSILVSCIEINLIRSTTDGSFILCDIFCDNRNNRTYFRKENFFFSLLAVFPLQSWTWWFCWSTLLLQT